MFSPSLTDMISDVDVRESPEGAKDGYIKKRGPSRNGGKVVELERAQPSLTHISRDRH